MTWRRTENTVCLFLSRSVSEFVQDSNLLVQRHSPLSHKGDLDATLDVRLGAVVCVEATSLSSKTSLSTHRLAATTTRLLNILLRERAQTTVYDLRPDPTHSLQPFSSKHQLHNGPPFLAAGSLLAAGSMGCLRIRTRRRYFGRQVDTFAHP
jgi:hypothetical protein